MKEFWDQRYSDSDYAYGTKPNAYFKKQLDKMEPGKILLPAEGEGRNAVYAARKGWEVVAFDLSIEGIKKAIKLADRVGVEIDFRTGHFDEMDFGEELFDAIAFIFVHMQPAERTSFHKSMVELLKPGGKLILEGFSKDQFTRTTGGPKNHDMLYSREELKSDFIGLSRIKISEREVMLNEGEYHQGLAAVIRATGTK